jgi:hypothetical protein
MVQKDRNRVWKWFMPGIFLAVMLICVGVSPPPLAAQVGVIYPATQKLGQATSATMENAGKEVQAVNQTVKAQSPGKLIESPGQAANRGKLRRDRGPRRHYGFEFWANGLPKGSDPTEAYWFETRDGKLMLVDPLVTQRYSHMPR